MTPGSGGIPALVWVSSNPSIATVNASTGLATAVASGACSITATCGVHGGGTTLTVGAGSGVQPGANCPSGYTVVMNTGDITAPIPSSFQVNGGTFTWVANGISHQWTNDSPTVKDSTGAWAGNIITPPNGAPGMASVFDQTLEGGAEPIRLSTGVFGSAGVGNLYAECQITLSSNWSYSKAGEIKVFNPNTVAPNNNHILTLLADGPNGQQATGAVYPALFLQGTATGETPGYVPTSNTSTGVPPSFAAHPSNYLSTIANLTLGVPHTVTWLVQQETTIGSSDDANLTIWVDGIKVYTSVGVSGSHFNICAGGWHALTESNDYGGDQPTDHPPASMYIVRNRYFWATK